MVFVVDEQAAFGLAILPLQPDRVYQFEPEWEDQFDWEFRLKTH